MTPAPYRQARCVLPALMTAAAVVATGLTLGSGAPAPAVAPAAAVADCPAGYSTFAEYQDSEQRFRAAATTGVDAQLLAAADEFSRAKAASGQAQGSDLCVNDQRPEEMRELAMRAAQQAAPRLAPFKTTAPGAFAAAAAERSLLQAAAVDGTAGTGKEYGKGPLTVDDPAFPSVNGLGLGDNSGRVDSFDYDPTAGPDGRLFAAVGSGGVWASDDIAVTWKPVSDTLPSTVTGAVGWAPAKGSRPGTLLALTGEPTFGASAYTGIGAYYASDVTEALAAGRQPTWQKATGLPDGALGFKLAVSPIDADLVFAATGLGLFRSEDGGRSYTNVNLPIAAAQPEGQPCAGVTDLAARPECALANIVTDVVVQKPGGTTDSPGGKVIAAVGWRGGDRVEPGTDITQAPSNGIYGSDTGAAGSFTKLNNNNTDSPTNFTEQVGIGRIELGAVTGTNQDHDYLYAIVQDARLINGGVDAIDAPVGGEDSAPLNPRPGGTVLEGIYVSDDFGVSWVRVADDNAIARNPAAGSSLTGVGTAIGFEPGVQAWYDLWIKPDPTVQSPAGVPTRLLFGMEEVWENEQSPATGLTGVVGPTSFKVIGRYFAGDSCQLLSLGAPTCPTNRAPRVSYTTHPDQQDAIFVPIDPADDSKGVRLIVGNDGGAYRQDLTPDSADDTTNDQQSQVQFGVGTGDFDNGHWGRGANIGFQTLLPYGAVMAKDGVVWAGLQDNGNLKIDPKRGFQQFETFGGDGFFTAVDPDNSDVSYEEVTLASMRVTIDGGTSWRAIPPPITQAKFANPFVMDPTQANHLMTAGNEVVETVSGPRTGQDGDWEQVYDLGTAGAPGDAAARPSAADPGNSMSALDLVSDAAYVGFCGVCDTLNTAAPFKNGLATNVGADVDPERMTSQGWHIAAAKGLPNRYITSVRIDPRDVETVYATVGGYTRRWVPPGTLGDENANIGDGHLYVSHDAGETFTDISANLPDAPATWVELRDDQVLVGTDLGAFASAPSGVTAEGFAPLADIPAVPVSSIEVSPQDPDLLTVATFGRGVWTYEFDDTVAPVTYERVQGANRVSTAVKTSQEQYRFGADTVVVAVSNQYADALAGAPLAYQLASPLLLTPGSALAPEAAAEVKRLGGRRAVVLGGPSALSPQVEAGLKAAGVTTVERIGGGDRFATAALVAGKLSDKSNVYVVEGADADPKRGWPDAISTGPLSALQGRPILLVTTEAVPEATKKAMADLAVTSATIVGGPAAVSTKVEEELAGPEMTVAVKRIAGADRYATSRKVADVLLAQKVDGERVWLATGQNFADALAAGPTVASDLGVMLLVDPTTLDRSPTTRTFLREQVGELRSVRFLGGPAAISENVVTQVRAAVAAGPPPPPMPTGTIAGPFDFEADEQGWTAEGSWARSDPGHDSAMSFAVAPYGDGEDSSLVSPELQSSGGTVFLSWFERRDTEAGFDGYTVDWSTDGEKWTTVGTYQGQNTGFPEFAEQSVTFEPPKGPLKVRYRFTSDDICSSTFVPGVCAGDGGYEGVFVDDVLIQK